jgi:TP901-1 family phage major tail protein
MTANVGRALHLYWGDASPQDLIAGVREKSLTMAGEAVDITNDDSGGWRALLNAAGVNAFDISVSGVMDNDLLRADWIAGAAIGGVRMQNMTIELPDGATITGEFYLSAFTETGTHDDAITFEATFMSNGAVVYTPGA